MWYSLLEDFLEIFGIFPSFRRARLVRVETRPTVAAHQRRDAITRFGNES
jgi:hypothetical protein